MVSQSDWLPMMMATGEVIGRILFGNPKAWADYTVGPGLIQGGGKRLGMNYPVLVNPSKPS
jgi:hypothetical protein